MQDLTLVLHLAVASKKTTYQNLRQHTNTDVEVTCSLVSASAHPLLEVVLHDRDNRRSY